MRKKIVAGNWKMNKTLDEGMQLTSEIAKIAQDEVPSDVSLILAPPFVHLASVSKILNGNDKVTLSAQNCSEHEAGAYTGEISVAMLSSAGVNHVIIGHSERREHYNESNELLANKIDVTLAGNLQPIVCCGESLSIRETDTHFEFVSNQLTESLAHLSTDDFGKIIIAYEPIWAIGTGKTATSDQAQEMHAYIRSHLQSMFGQSAENTTILYGGSCKPGNAGELFSGMDVDGGLIGGASLNARDFIDIALSF